jgi:cyclic pyranopterin phosphate synthase
LAQPLKDAGLGRINISLDSLQPERFHQITRTGQLSDVLAGIKAAQAAGFKNIKLNCVILRGRNDDEIIDIVDFARQQQLDLAFIEEMPLGVITEHQRSQTHISNDEIRQIITQQYPLLAATDNTGGPCALLSYGRQSKPNWLYLAP